MTWFRIHYKTGKEDMVDGEAERDRLMARRRPKAVSFTIAKVHQCSVCNDRGPWTDDWSWFGSWKAVDDGKPIKKFCSKECRLVFSPKRPERDPNKTWDETQQLGHHEALPRKARQARYAANYQATQAKGAHRKFEMPNHPKLALEKGEGQCRWCGEKITGKYAYQRSWHTARHGDRRDCQLEWCSHTDREYQYRLLAGRDGMGCADCGRGDGHWIAGPSWKPDWFVQIHWSVELQVDHETPLYLAQLLPHVEWRRSLFGPDNLKLRCVPCHKKKSALEAKDRSARGL